MVQRYRPKRTENVGRHRIRVYFVLILLSEIIRVFTQSYRLYYVMRTFWLLVCSRIMTDFTTLMANRLSKTGFSSCRYMIPLPRRMKDGSKVVLCRLGKFLLYFFKKKKSFIAAKYSCSRICVVNHVHNTKIAVKFHSQAKNRFQSP